MLPRPGPGGVVLVEVDVLDVQEPEGVVDRYEIRVSERGAAGNCLVTFARKRIVANRRGWDQPAAELPPSPSVLVWPQTDGPWVFTWKVEPRDLPPLPKEEFEVAAREAVERGG